MLKWPYNLIIWPYYVKQDKSTALTILRQQRSPISLKELLQQLEPDYSERTLRRWLSTWEKTGLVIKSGQKRGTLYTASSHESLAESNKLYFSPESQNIIMRIQRPSTLRKPITYNPQWLKHYRPNVDAP